MKHTKSEIGLRKFYSGNNNLEKNERFMILRNTIDWISSRKEISLLAVIVKKHVFTSSKEIFELVKQTY